MHQLAYTERIWMAAESTIKAALVRELEGMFNPKIPFQLKKFILVKVAKRLSGHFNINLS